MRRRNACLMFGGFLFAIGLYATWAALPFMRPIFIYAADVPDDARAAMNEWRKTSVYLEPELFWNDYLSSLMTPYEMKPRWTTVEMESPDRARMSDGGVGGITFVRDAKGRWKGWHHGCFGSQPVR